MAKTRAGETLVVPGHPDYEPQTFDELAARFERVDLKTGDKVLAGETEYVIGEPYIHATESDDGWDADCG